jgi:DNA primase
VATLGTATTPVHAQKLFRQTDTVVFCFDGDNAGRKAAWRALENTLPVLADGRNARFLFLPEGEDPDDFVRKRGKAAFEAALGTAVPLSEFLLRELAAQHPPTDAEGRASLVAAARPHLAAIEAPVLRALIVRRLAELSGLPEAELRALLGSARPPARPADVPDRAERHDEAPAPRRVVRGFSRRGPSLARELIQGLLLQPALARETDLPRPDDGTPEGAALAALLEHCRSAAGELSTAVVMQHFADSPHDAVLATALALAEDQALPAEHVAGSFREGVARWRLAAQRAGTVDADGAGMAPEEAERLRQLALVKQGVTGGRRDPSEG